MKIHAKPPRPKPPAPAEARAEPRPRSRRRRRIRSRCCWLLAAVGRRRGEAQPVYRCGNAYSPSPCRAGQRGRSSTIARSAARSAPRRCGVAASEKRLADDMARDRAARSGAPAAGAGASARARPPAHGRRAARRSKARRRRRRHSRDERRGLRRRRTRTRRAVTDGWRPPAARAPPARRLGLQPPVLRPQRLASISTCAGSIGMQSTGQTCTHCGSSKWPTHSVQRAGSIT